MPRTLRVAALMVLIALGGGLAACTTGPKSADPQMRKLVQADIAQVMRDIDHAAESSPGIGMSSNPFTYVGISAALPRLVSRGAPALEPITAEIEASKEDGLREYLLAIAGQQILNLPAQDSLVASGKEWARWYRSRGQSR
jgi:hypothetical protein